jgi:BMFP domain-containing protein YqiC
MPTPTMEKAAFLDDLQQRLASLMEGTLLSQQFAQFELVTREEFDAQVRVLARTREKLQELERRLAELEARRD